MLMPIWAARDHHRQHQDHDLHGAPQQAARTGLERGRGHHQVTRRLLISTPARMISAPTTSVGRYRPRGSSSA